MFDIFFEHQTVYPNTHCLGIDKSMGLQWVLSDASECTEGPNTHCTLP